MEATVVSVGKSVLSGALGYAKFAVAEELALQLGIERDHAFIRDELEMMLAFLMAAHDEHDEHMLVKTRGGSKGGAPLVSLIPPLS